MPQPAVPARAGRRRLASRAARELLVSLLARVTGTSEPEWAVSPPGEGRPFVTRHPVDVQAPFVSLSHDGNMVACAASWEGPVGIDVQHDRPADRLRAIASFLRWPACLVESNDARRLTHAWATWEACAKASGASVLGPVPGFPDAMEALQGRPSSARCIDQRLVDGWLVVVDLPAVIGACERT